ncbi:MAG TPA: phosphatidate cytidylyltransferase, partial [Acidimicrobiia bacterium]|nr:phosphatidate cytidylyltransferase [Acidimicrobiia bacterium]
DCDALADDESEAAVIELGTTIDLTGRASRGGADDLDVWSDVLRRRPAEAARLTGHPSAAGERIAAAAAARRRAPTAGTRRERDDDLAGAPTTPGRKGAAGEGDEPGEGDAPAAAGNVSRLRPVPPDPDGSGRSKGLGSDLVTRVVTGAAMAAGGLLVLNAGPGPASVLVSLIVAVGVIELCGALRTQGYRPAGLVALVGSVALVLGAYHSGVGAFAAVAGFVAPATLLWYLAGFTKARPAPGIASTMLAFGYVGVMGGFAGLILALPDGVGLLLGVVLCCVAVDICGYLAGRRFGRRHIAPQISPNKTVEGLLAGMAGSIVVGFVLVGSISPWGRFSALALGVVVAVVAPLGDLSESLIKRDLGVKDLGGLLPGHGGVLDRFDAMLFALPAVYYLIRLLGVV